jgi:hypothetical protein
MVPKGEDFEPNLVRGKENKESGDEEESLFNLIPTSNPKLSIYMSIRDVFPLKNISPIIKGTFFYVFLIKDWNGNVKNVICIGVPCFGS